MIFCVECLMCDWLWGTLSAPTSPLHEGCMLSCVLVGSVGLSHPAMTVRVCVHHSGCELCGLELSRVLPAHPSIDSLSRCARGAFQVLDMARTPGKSELAFPDGTCRPQAGLWALCLLLPFPAASRPVLGCHQGLLWEACVCLGLPPAPEPLARWHSHAPVPGRSAFLTRFYFRSRGLGQT